MIQRTETNLNDWLNDDIDEENNAKTEINNEEIYTDTIKKNNNNINDDDIEIKKYEEEKRKKNENDIYNQLFQYMQNLQPKAKKKS